MRKLCISALIIGGIVAIPGAGVIGQDMATAPAKVKANYLVFLDGGNMLSSTAADTVRKAADASRDARGVRIEGPAPQVQSVREELIRHGVRAESISTLPARGALKKPADGAPDPAQRFVEIKI